MLVPIKKKDGTVVAVINTAHINSIYAYEPSGGTVIEYLNQGFLKLYTVSLEEVLQQIS